MNYLILCFSWLASWFFSKTCCHKMEDYILFQMMLVYQNAAWFRYIGANGNLETLMFKHSITVDNIEVILAFIRLHASCQGPADYVLFVPIWYSRWGHKPSDAKHMMLNAATFWHSKQPSHKIWWHIFAYKQLFCTTNHPGFSLESLVVMTRLIIWFYRKRNSNLV